MRLFWSAVAVAMALAGCAAENAPAQGRASQASAPKASALDLLLQAIGGHRMALLGEMHGTQEAPALAGQLVSHYAAAHDPVLLGLEIDHDEQADVDRFLASNGDARARTSLLAAAHWLAPFDGRDSEAMFELIDHVRRLRAAGADVRIVYFDHSDSDMDRRNRRMADTLRAAAARNPGAMLLVLTGNVHAMTHRPPGDLYMDGKRIEPPMTVGRYLADLRPVSFDIGAASGEYWACTGGQCKRQGVRLQAPIANPALEAQAPTDSAWDFALTLPDFHASTPAVEAAALRPSAAPDPTTR